VRASHQRIIDRIDQYYLLSADQAPEPFGER
jgi:hypothetical protein